MKITIIIPAFNEEKTISILIQKILKLNLLKQIIIVDDGSTDNTLQIINKYKQEIDTICIHKKNLGKGAAIKTASKYIDGDIVLIQDADLEYDPSDYFDLIEPIKNNKSDVVYGSRVLGKERYFQVNFISFMRTFANHVLTIISNILNNQKLTDAHTCYKVFRSNIFNELELEESGFSFCPEVTTKLSKKKISITEVPIKYEGRNLQQGKKIRFTDAIIALRTLIKYRYFQ